MRIHWIRNRTRHHNVRLYCPALPCPALHTLLVLKQRTNDRRTLILPRRLCKTPIRFSVFTDSAKMMHMTFYWSRYVTILIDSWRTSTWLGYFLSLLACLIVGIFYQYLEDLRVRLKLLAASASKKSSSADALQIEVPLLRSRVSAGKLSAARVAGALMFGVNSAIGYMLMLAVMSFNGGVLVAVCLGLAIGYLVFRSGDEEAIFLESNACACA